VNVPESSLTVMLLTPGEKLGGSFTAEAAAPAVPAEAAQRSKYGGMFPRLTAHVRQMQPGAAPHILLQLEESENAMASWLR
jgi:hypothetical protein